MRRLLMAGVVCVASCRSPAPPPPPEPRSGVSVDAPFVKVRVSDDGGVKVYDDSGRGAVPTVVVPGR